MDKSPVLDFLHVGEPVGVESVFVAEEFAENFVDFDIQDYGYVQLVEDVVFQGTADIVVIRVLMADFVHQPVPFKVLGGSASCLWQVFQEFLDWGDGPNSDETCNDVSSIPPR